MKIRLDNFSPRILNRIFDSVEYSRTTGLHIPVPKSSIPNIQLWLIGISIFILLLFIQIGQWAYLYWSMAIVIGFVYLITVQVQIIWRWYKLGKDSIFFDSSFLYSLSGSEISIFPLKLFLNSDITLSSRRQKRYLARFYFQGTSILIPCSSENDEKTLYFQKKLFEFSKLAKQDNFEAKKLIDNENKLKNFLSCKQIPFTAVTFTLMLSWFIIPILIDQNQYLLAKTTNSPSSFRTYLGDARNIRHRDDAKKSIKVLYDLSIKKYLTSSINAPGCNAFVKVLEYLRDHDLYTVNMVFYPQEQLVDRPHTDFKKIIPVTPSFSPEKNHIRQEKVIMAVNSSLSKIFPTDIFTIHNEDSIRVPVLEIYYTYRNNPETMYYPVKEENLPNEDRTWYYGIEIEWSFIIKLPNLTEQVYNFSLISHPALQFDSEKVTPYAVYSNMALSAFNDFEAEFNNQFFKNRTSITF